MALKERIHSLETEYAVSYVSDQRQRRKPGTGNIVETLKRALANSHGLPSTEFTVNGSKLYHDVGHAEWAQPECRSARELAIYDKAADHLLLHSVVPRADRVFADSGHVGRLVVAKNNADPYGTTYGCHENYQMQRDADLLASDDFIRYLAQCMVPFLVSRQILTGSGYLVITREPGQTRVVYEFSQRAAFIQTVVSRDTTKFRPIFNLGREGESFAAGNFRRLHQILGDANLSGWATFVKMGSTGLILRLVEDLYIDRIPALVDPVAALHKISGDLTGTNTVRLQNGQQVSALDIQWMYYDLVDGYLNIFGASEDDEDIMEAWGKALEDFEQNPMSLRDRADWAIKKHLLDVFLEQRGHSFENLPLRDQNLLTELQAFDLRYHELSLEGLYYKLHPVDTLVSLDEIRQAQETPPPYTRARIRGEAIRLGRQYNLRVNTGSWNEIGIEGQRIVMPDPLAFDHPHLAEWDRPWEQLELLIAAQPDDKWLHYRLGKSYEAAGQYHKALNACQQAIDHDDSVPQFLQSLARCHLLIGDHDAALRWGEKYAQRVDNPRAFDPAYESHLDMGHIYRHRNEPDKALDHYRQATRNRRISAEAYAYIAQVHLKRGEIRSAETYFRKASAAAIVHLAAPVGLGAILYARGEHDQARQHFNNALALSMHHIEETMTRSAARYYQAVAHIALGTERAVTAFDLALTDQTTAAADGILIFTTLLDLLAQGEPAPAPLAEVYAQARSITMQPVPQQESSPPHVPAERIAWLRNAVNHHSLAVRTQALRYLSWRLDADHLHELSALTQILIDTAQHDPDPQIQRAALQALARPELRDTPLMEEVIACLQDENRIVRWAAQSSLEDITLRGTPASAGSTELHATVSGSPAQDTDALSWLQSLADRQANNANVNNEEFDDDIAF